MPPNPWTVPASVRQRIAVHAVTGVEDAADLFPRPDAETRRRTARLLTLGATHADLSAGDGVGLDGIERQKLRQGIGVLIDAAEDVAHGAVGEITDAGIAAAQRKAKCRCGPTFVRVLKAIIDACVEGAFAGLRAAAKV